MAVPNGRMRLTVEVLPLTSENAHGPNRAAALAEFKGRKFALPVQLHHTFEQVWQQIEERYKKNYLSPLQASYFVIKKLQDAYDCDLDLRDTVGDIFEGESDPQMRMIKVVPTFINRDFSMPPNSFLRPSNTHKRAREMSMDTISKRQRLEEQAKAFMETDPSRDRPITSTESVRQTSVIGTANAGLRQNEEQSNRSRSSSSLILVLNARTGNEEYGAQLKEEPPELGSIIPLGPPQKSNDGFKKPILPASKTVPLPLPEVTANLTPESADLETGDTMMNMGSPLQDISTEVVSGSADIATDVVSPSAPGVDSQDSGIRQSPMSTPEPTETLETQDSNNQLGNHREESEAPFLHQPTASGPRVTYGARATTSVDTAPFVQKAAHMLNGARSQPNTAPASRSQPRTPHVAVESPKSRQTSQRKSSTASQVRLGRPAEEYSSALTEERRTHTPVLSRQSRSTPNVPSQRASPHDSRDSIGSPPSIKHASSPLTSRKPRRRLSPKVVVPIRSPSSRTEPRSNAREVQQSLEPTPREPTLDTQEKIAPPKAIETAKEQLTGPRKTPVPLPENVRHLSGAQLSRQNVTSAAMIPKTSKTGIGSMLKAASKGQKQMATVAGDDAPTLSANPTGSQSFQTPLQWRASVYDVPSSESPPPRGSVRALAPKSQSKSQPKKTPVPLPLNVRHLSGAKTKTQRNITSSEEDSSVSKIVSPILNKRLTRASINKLGSTSKADKVLRSQSAMKQAFVSGSESHDNAEKGIQPSTTDSSSTNSEVDHSKGKKISAAKGKSLTDDEEKHKSLMKKIFPEGLKKSRRELDNTRKYFGKKPPDPVRDLESNLANEYDADANSNAIVEREVSSDKQLDSNEKAAVDSIQTHQNDESPKQQSDAANEQIMQEETSRIDAASRPSPSWAFDGICSPNNHLDQTEEGATSKPQEEPTMNAGSGETTETDNDDIDKAESKANSAVQSTRSSPDVSRRPARYLSHSPTPKESESEDDDQVSSPSRAVSSEVDNDAAGSKDGDSTESSSELSDMESEHSDVEQDTNTPKGDTMAPPSTNPQSSSPLPLATQPTTLVPATQNSRLQRFSQPSPTGTPAPHAVAETPRVPASQPTPSAFGSSQSISQLAAARRAPFYKFPSVKQQLHAAMTSSASTPKSKAFDPRMVNMHKWGKKTAKSFDVSDSSSDEESSGSSTDDEQSEQNQKKASCSVV